MKSYDYLILGAGWGGLTTASLLAKAGHRVAVLETQDRAGGAGQSFSLDGFSFCAEMQYLMECGPGGVVHEWLSALDLLDKVQFNSLDEDGYDRIEIPDLSFRFPHDAHRLQDRLGQTFPDEQEKIDRVFEVLFAIDAELNGQVFDVKHFLANPLQFKNSVLYGPWSVKRVFDHFELSPPLQAVLAGQCGDLGLPPSEEPFFCLKSVLFGYCVSAHFPKKGMGHFVDCVVDYVTAHSGEVHFETPVTAIERDGNRITCVQTPRGPFSARFVVSNIDPATTMAMIQDVKPPSYAQSESCFTVFLGLDIDLSQRGFGRCNVWHFPSVDLDAAIAKAVDEHCYEDPFFFLSTPSLYTDPGVLAPLGCTTVQINVASSFDYFEEAMRNGTHASEKERVTAQILRAVERRLIPDLTKHCVVQESWSPVDLASRTGLARGGMYGARLDFKNRILKRVWSQTEFENLFLTGATAGGPGMQGVVTAGMKLVADLLEAEKPGDTLS